MSESSYSPSMKTSMLKIAKKRILFFRELVKGKVEAFPGILKWLEQFQSRGAKQAITSSAPPENIEALVKALDIEGNFDVTVSGIRLARKAQPGYFLKATRATQVSPENCIVIEDVIAGVEGAKRAEMKCIAVRFQ